MENALPRMAWIVPNGSCKVRLFGKIPRFKYVRHKRVGFQNEFQPLLA